MWAVPFVANIQKKFDIGHTTHEPSATANSNKLQTNPPSETGRDSEVDSTLPEWKRRMIAKNEEAKKEVTDIMDDSLKRVMIKTELKPEAQRGQAVDSYVSSVDWIMWSVNKIISRAK